MAKMWLWGLIVINVYSTIIFFMVFAILTRELAVYRLRKIDISMWERFGCPGYFERDYFFLKYPYRGWLIMFNKYNFFDKTLLLLFAFSNMGLFISIGISFVSVVFSR